MNPTCIVSGLCNYLYFLGVSLELFVLMTFHAKQLQTAIIIPSGLLYRCKPTFSDRQWGSATFGRFISGIQEEKFGFVARWHHLIKIPAFFPFFLFFGIQRLCGTRKRMNLAFGWLVTMQGRNNSILSKIQRLKLALILESSRHFVT